MKKTKYYREVKVTERLPQEEGAYTVLTESARFEAMYNKKQGFYDFGDCTGIVAWLEPFTMPEPRNVAHAILLEELEENSHPERVEDVIFWSLHYYKTNRKQGTWGETIAHAITQRILDGESAQESKTKTEGGKQDVQDREKTSTNE